MSLLTFLTYHCHRRVFLSPVPKKSAVSSLLTTVRWHSTHQKQHPSQSGPSTVSMPRQQIHEDAIFTALHSVFTHFENNNTYIRMLFVDFSSAFNTITPWNWTCTMGLVPHSTGYWTSSRTEHRQFGLVVTPPPLQCWTPEPPRAMCSVPSCLCSKPTISVPNMERSCEVCRYRHRHRPNFK